MKNCAPEKIRNFVLAGHAGAGKTALADLILFKGGAVSRQGSVDNGTSVSDYRKEEQARKSSIYPGVLHTAWKDGHFFFMDTPGTTDFVGRALPSIEIADLMVLVIDAAAGIGPGTITALKHAKIRNMPRIVFINGCDRDSADYDTLLDLLQQSMGKTKCLPVSLPDGIRGSFKGVLSALDEKAAPDAHSPLMDTIAEGDEELMMKYMEEGALTPEEIKIGFRKAVLSGSLYPVYAGSVAKDIGVQELMDAILDFAPAPTDDVPLNLASGTIDRKSSDVVAYVFQSVIDPHMGQLSFLRVLSGTLTANSELVNAQKQAKERLGTIQLAQGKDLATVDAAGPGEIVVVAKLKNTGLTDILGSKQVEAVFTPIEYPQPTTIFAVSAAAKGEEDKLAQGLAKQAAEDPTIQIRLDTETKQTVLSCMGDQQLKLIVNRLKNDSKVEAVLETPRIPYRETINGVGQASYRHKKQNGGHGQFAEVHMRLEPYTPAEGETDYQFANEVVGGNVPKNFIPAIEKGVGEVRLSGPLSHSKVINFKAVVFDGKYHPVDSSEMAFKIATRHAFRDAMAQAKPMLLEPIMSLRIYFPTEYQGAISGDLNTRRGRVLGMDPEEGFQVLNAEVPLAEAYSYPTALRSMTQGRGFFEMKFDRYEQVPKMVADKIQAAAAAEADNDEE